MAEQIKTLQIQLVELTTRQASSQINYAIPPQQNLPPNYYTPEANWMPPLNRPYETTSPQQNTWNQQRPWNPSQQNNQARRPNQGRNNRNQGRRIIGNCYNCRRQGHIAASC